MKKLTAAAALAALAFGGCATEGASENNTGENGVIGKVETALSIPGGYNIASVAYTVENSANAVVDSGSVAVDHSNKILFQVGALPIANDYEMILTAQAVNTVGEEDVNCEGRAEFDITNNGLTLLTMTMVCQGDPVTDLDTVGDIRTEVNVTQEGDYACPVPVGISALGASVDVGFDVQLEGFLSSPADSVQWSGVGGTFSADTSLATAFTCGTPGDWTLTLTATKARCVDTTLTVNIECTGVVTNETSCTDGIDNDGDTLVDCADVDDCGSVFPCLPAETACTDGVDNDLNGDVDCADANCQAIEPSCVVTPACEQCMRDSCGPASGLDLAGPCFDSVEPGFGGTTPQPLFSQICIDTVECSYNASTNCFLDSIGPSQCYCGEISLGQCEGSGPDTATAPCKLEWEQATICDGIADPVAKNSCVTGAFQDLTKPAGYAFFLSNCAAASCVAECTN